jgi:uncharacterized protein involved in exopolysaccharide biosynthesis
MAAPRSLAPDLDEGGLRLELTTAEVRQVCALYAHPFRSPPSHTRTAPAPTRAPLDAFARELRALAWRARRTLALTCIAALSLGAIFLLVATPTFAVTAQLVVEQRGARGEGDGAQGDASAFLAGQAEILGSASIVERALRRAPPGASAESRGVVDRVRAWLPRFAQRTERADRDALSRALRAFSAAPVFGTELIALEYRTQDPASGVLFVQAVIGGYEEFASSLQSGEKGVRVRTLAAPARGASPLWPRVAPVLTACLALGLLAGLGRAWLAERAEKPRSEWSPMREPAWAG